MMRYKFDWVLECEMCGDKTESHRIVGQRMNTSQGMNPKSKKGISVTVQKCTACGLIYSNPQPIPFDIGDHYGMPPESYWSSNYFSWDESYFSGQIATLKNLLKFTPGMKALDIGAGIGKCMKSLEHAGFDVYGFEPSQPFYERALSRMGIKSERLKLGAIEDVDYDPDTFDFITFGAVFEHLYHPRLALEKAFRWLKKDGIIQIEVPSSRHLMASIIDNFYRLKGTTYTTHLSPMHSPFHLYEFDIKSFEALSAKLGYSIVQRDYMVGRVLNFPKIFHPILKSIMKSTNRGLQLTVWLKKH